MRLSLGPRTTAAAAVAGITLTVLACGPAVAADGSPGASPSTTPTQPSRSEVADARDAAATAAEEVDAITARLERAEQRLEALQVELAEAVSAHERAGRRLAEAEAAVARAGADLTAARAAHEAADDALSGHAALIYMQGGSLQNLTALLLTPTNTMSDLALVLDGNARRVQEDLDAATAAAWEAAARERESLAARTEREAAARQARATREAAEQEAERASAQAARLGEQLEELTLRLEELEAEAVDLEARRAEAAELGVADLLGIQDDVTAGSEPAAARRTARDMLPEFGWDGEGQYECLVTLWHHESGWSWSATNRSSGAYGIPQALPGWKMASAGSDWLTNPATQIAWGLGYIDERYGSPCGALDAFLGRSPHWY
jgi:hypothetical protein